jgi:hypothetical protein
MKATIEIPDELYRRVKARSALEGLTVREVAVTLFRTWTEKGLAAEKAVPAVPVPERLAPPYAPAGSALHAALRLQTPQ